MKGLSRIFLVVVSLVSVFFADAGEAFAGKSDDTLVAAFRRGVKTLDYHRATAREAIILSRLTDDGLVHLDPETSKYVPLAAKSYKFVDDTTIDFEIRPGIYFHYGGMLTADDVIYSYNWVLNRKSRTSRRRLISQWLAGVSKVGPATVRFKMKYPYPLALRDIEIGVPLRKKGVYHRADGTMRRNAQRQRLNGIGPYRVIGFERNKRAVLERFDNYYKDSPKGRPAIKRIVVRVIPDWVTQQGELVDGDIDWIYDVPTDIARAVSAMGRGRHLTGDSMRIGFISMDAGNVTRKANNPFARLQVRRAMIHAIDREAIVKTIVKGRAQVIHSACHPAQFGCTQDVARYEYDPEKAKKLIIAAGYPNGFGFDFWVYREKVAARRIIADLAKVGIRARPNYVRAGRLAGARRRHEVEAYFGSWGAGGTADVAAIATRHWSLKSDRNLSADEEVETLMLGAQRTLEPERRKEMYGKALRRIADRAYWVPLYSFSLNYLISNDLDFPVPKDGLPRLYRASWK